MFSKIRSLIISILIIAASGCDGGYWLVHIPDEGDEPAADSRSYTYSETKGAFCVKIEGGATQSPYTRKVQARYLTIYWESRCEDSCEYVFRQPSIISGHNIISPTTFFADYYPLESNKRKDIDGLNRYERDDLSEITFAVAPGRVKLSFRYSSFYDSLGFLQFPITANFGYIVCGGDTLTIDSIKFGATRKGP